MNILPSLLYKMPLPNGNAGYIAIDNNIKVRQKDTLSRILWYSDWLHNTTSAGNSIFVTSHITTSGGRSIM